MQEWIPTCVSVSHVAKRPRKPGERTFTVIWTLADVEETATPLKGER
jgi:hypothetical protein